MLDVYIRTTQQVFSTQMLSLENAVAGAALLHAATGQFVPAPTDLKSIVGYADYTVRYKQVPDGICETTPNVTSYSGLVPPSPRLTLSI